MNFTASDAERLRAQGESMVSCGFCIEEGRPDHYVRFHDSNVVGATIACPEHNDTRGFGLCKVGPAD